MKVLYAIQSTGNGHLIRAKEIIPFLKRRFDFDVMLSGPKTNLDLGYPIKYHQRGLTFYFNKSGSINWVKTIFKNNLFQFIKDVLSLPVKDYDLVITDFEPISAWACKFRGVLSFGLSNQITLWQKESLKPKKLFSSSLKYLKYFAPTELEYGLHYQKFNDRIFLPIIRAKLRSLKVTKGGGIVVYLPAYDLKRITKVLSLFPNVKWTIFSKEINEPKTQGSLRFFPINEDHFSKKLAKSDGIITSAGFTTTSEALFLGKTLLVIPMRGQIEQSFNAQVLKKMGVTVVKELSIKKSKIIEHWIKNPNVIKVNFENDLNYLVDQIALDYIKIKHKKVLDYKLAQ